MFDALCLREEDFALVSDVVSPREAAETRGVACEARQPELAADKNFTKFIAFLPFD